MKALALFVLLLGACHKDVVPGEATPANDLVEDAIKDKRLLGLVFDADTALAVDPVTREVVAPLSSDLAEDGSVVFRDTRDGSPVDVSVLGAAP